MPSHARPLQVLVVDDNENAADALTIYLALSGINAKAAYGGATAIALALEWRPDVILLDISMPGLDGFAVAKRLRDEPQVSDVVIVALTAHDESYVSGRATPNDFDAYCQKGQMLAALDALLGQLQVGRKTYRPR
ncbi:response regulator [Paraburkholderia sp. 22098]|uniref:response regulator n=1 Tax=Paraburkholderia sp. 22098 TaxID=3453874 RepID=UPI003F856771